MGGGKPKKPLSALDKQRKKVIKTKKVSTKEEKKVIPTFVDESLIRRAKRAVMNMDVVTPSVLASALSVRVSVAKKVLRMLIDDGTLKLIDKSREIIIAVPNKAQ